MTILDSIRMSVKKDSSVPIIRQCMTIVFVIDIFSSNDIVHDFTESSKSYLRQKLDNDLKLEKSFDH
jgi:hypothetical protein